MYTMKPSWSCFLQYITIGLICLIVSTSSCFIRNCPPGGKRSMESMPPEVHIQRECMRCGPDGLGQCIGPNICCGPSIGCYMASAETEICQKENDNPAPCEIEGKLCGTEAEGRCVAAGVCCDDEKCSLDYHCESDRGPVALVAGKRTNKVSPDLLKIIRRLIDHKPYQRRK